MSNVTIPPEKPETPSEFARPALVRHPKTARCTAGSILSNLWNEGIGKTDLFIHKRKMQFHIDVVEEGAARYYFQTKDDRQAVLDVFKDFSALIHERYSDDSVRVTANPLRLNQTYRPKDDPDVAISLLRKTYLGTTNHAVRSSASGTEEISLLPGGYQSQSRLHRRADALQAQILHEARWWQANTPTPTQDCPPIGAAFQLAREEDKALLRQAMLTAVHAAATVPDVARSFRPGNLGVLIYPPIVQLPDGRPGPFRVMTSFITHDIADILPLIEDYIRRCIAAHPNIFAENYLAQEGGHPISSLSPVARMIVTETPSAHEAMEAQLELRAWEAQNTTKENQNA